MILSILIPSIPSRREKLTRLLTEMYSQVLKLNINHPTLGSVEILVDDSIPFLEGGLHIGQKRELLKQRAGGKYLCFLDDDDTITPNYIETLVRLCNEGNDVVTFRALIKNDHYWAIIDMNLENLTNTEVNPHDIIKRTPWHICPIKSEIGKRETFSKDNVHNDDWFWMEKVLPKLKTQSHSDMILTQYNHSEIHSEADKIFGVPITQNQRTVLISLAVDGREKYSEKSINLQRSIAENWPYDVRLYREYPEYCTPNAIIPYKFKFDLIDQAKRDGYTRIVWLDSSIRLLADPCQLFGEEGLIGFHNLGHPLYQYISDIAVRNLNVSPADLSRIPQTWGGAIGFDFTKAKAGELFNEIKEHATNGSFETNGSIRKDFVAHRHDQAVMSILFWKHKYKLLPYGFIAAHADITEQTILQYGD